MKASTASMHLQTNQLVLQAEEEAEFARLSTEELARLADEYQLKAFAARHYLWLRVRSVSNGN